MALGALLSAIGEDDAGALHALQPVAGRTLIEYQARCAAAIGAAPIVVLVERVPPALQAAMERLRGDGVSVFPVTDAMEAAARFDDGLEVLQVADGIAPVPQLMADLADEAGQCILTVGDDEQHRSFERIDDRHRWAGLARVESALLSDTARMLGDWDLQSTLLRRTVQEGARLLPVGEGLTPFIAGNGDSAETFDRHLIKASRSRRRDWPSRFILPAVEEVLSGWVVKAPIRPAWLLFAAVALVLVGGILATRGLAGWGLALILIASPLDRLAERLASIRLQPLPPSSLLRRSLAPAHGLALLALGWFETRHGGGWGAMVAATACLAFAEAARVERRGRELPGDLWLLSPRSAAFAAIPFAVAGWWSLLTVALAIYACISFFVVQHFVREDRRD